ncbi:glycerol-3-phosphate 1-O-acyltransferase PlsY [Desulfovibrio sp. OttesenSCG-928-F07]|nr:glycerol-3-phosphate 1-O-acyltransferase PlsY [Desulfovibrio sp. OttesenSCG-928-F07]
MKKLIGFSIIFIIALAAILTPEYQINATPWAESTGGLRQLVILQIVVLIALGAYLLGSVPFGLIIAKAACGIDPRTEGSKNVGSTNVARLCGFKFGVLTLVCDALKGLLPTALSLHLFADPLVASAVGLCALLGHLYSIFLNFKGGKAVATTVGVFIPLSFPALVASAVICLLVIWRSRYVSLGSLTLATCLPVALALFGRFELIPFALVVMLLIFVKHRENIKRLISGQEKTFIKNKE